MKKFMNLPWDDQIIEKELIDYRWEIVTVHFENSKERFRAMKIDDSETIIKESMHDTKEMAEAYIAQQS